MKFEELNLAPAILQAVREQGYEQPTPIQEQAIPAVLQGSDLLAGAQTGTGKTAAYALPMLQRLDSHAQAPSQRRIRALVLAPTRELAAQVEEQVRAYGKYLESRSAVIFGGVGMTPQIEALRSGVDILVATPGRLLDLQQQGFVDLSHVEILVLDEADRMLDMGFIHDVRKVLALVPAQKQSLLFSATFSDEIRDLANGLLNAPLSIQVTPKNTTVQRIRQIIHPVGRSKKKAVLLHIIEQNNWSQVLVFTRTKYGANSVAEYLSKNGVQAMALHGNKSQTARTQALAGFKNGTIRALVATDIAARGIDIDDLPHVVNYEIPNVPEDYVHRIGRTGRAGASGEAVSLVCMDEEGFMQEIERFTSQEIAVQFIEGFGPDEGEKAEPIAMGRQTLWGGLGKPPSREVLQAAARAARAEMMQRIRENRTRHDTKHHAHGGNPTPAPANDDDPHAANERPPANVPIADGSSESTLRRPRRGPRNMNIAARKNRGNRNSPRQAHSANAPHPADRATPHAQYGEEFSLERPERQPRHFGNAKSPTQANAVAHRRAESMGNTGAAGQPDPLRTSVDSFLERGGKRGSGPGFNRRRNNRNGNFIHREH